MPNGGGSEGGLAKDQTFSGFFFVHPSLMFIIVYFLSYHSSSLTGVGSESGAASPYTPSVVKTEKQTNLMFDVTGI